MFGDPQLVGEDKFFDDKTGGKVGTGDGEGVLTFETEI